MPRTLTLPDLCCILIRDQEISTSTCIVLPQLRLLTAHLVHWGFARIITTISLFNTYGVRY